jgi:hypothetical protein
MICMKVALLLSNICRSRRRHCAGLVAATHSSIHAHASWSPRVSPQPASTRVPPASALAADYQRDSAQQLQRSLQAQQLSWSTDEDDVALGGSSAPSGEGTASATDTVGVLLLNLGGPDSLEDVQPFLYNLFADPDIIRLPPGAKFLQPLLATAISSIRAPQVRH